MQFGYLQKITSFFLIFFLLFSLTVRIPFLAFFDTQTYAQEEKFYDLISIIVDEDIYNEVKSKLVRYTQDVQATLENTRVVILPTPATATSLDIASLHEKLYFEGYKGVKDVNFESKLIGTVLVGDIPMPLVFSGNNSSRTLLPYTDFEEKSYIYSHENQRYELDSDAPTTITPEIWHGVISPNSGDRATDIDLIKGYFDKNHDFYKGEGNFQKDAGVINAKQSDTLGDSYEPFVFYYDQFRETQALSYEKYKGYQAYLQNQEDITYNRYTKELAEKVKNQVLGIQNENLKDLIEKAIPGFPTEGISAGPDIQYTPDIQTRYITDNATNKFLEIFNEGTLADIRKYVHNAGRYNGQGSEVNVDMAPFLISVLDQVSAQVVKNVNTNIEGKIDNIVKNGLARDIAIPVSRILDSTIGGTFSVGSGGSCSSTYTNFYYGEVASTIETAADCSIYRGSLAGSGKLVEANRGLNIKNIQPDLNICGAQTRTSGTDSIVTGGISGYWAGNTPVNLLKDSLGSSQFELGAHDLKGGIRPVFDIVGTLQKTNSALVPSPLNCFDNNFLLTTKREWVTVNGGSDEGSTTTCELQIQVPINGAAAEGWSCNSVNTKLPTTDTFQSQYVDIGNTPGGECVVEELNLSGVMVRIKSEARTPFGCGGSENPCNACPGKTTYDYKNIPSFIEHKSPTNQEFGSQIQALTSPALPIDKDRYIDFIAANGSYKKINYPYLFRVSPEVGQELTLENIDRALEKHLDEVSENINSVILSGNPNTLGVIEREIYELLKNGEYPSANIDLHQDLKSRPLQTFTIEGDSKSVSYYDTLVFSIYWNNLKTVSGKYKFIFENYLSDQFGGNDYLFNLPRNKKSYEVAYLGAPGDAENMYIKLDPEQKANNPFASIIAKNIALNTSLLSSNVISPTDKDGTFKCAPPDGVPIWEWIPAIVCWLQDLLPPTIGISEGSCGPSLLSEEEQEEILACQGDVNKNGISDCIEGKLDGGSIELYSDSQKYYYNKVGTLGAVLRDKKGAVVTLDSISYVDFSLSKLEVPDNNLEEFTASNTKIIYDVNNPAYNSKENYEEAQKYISFKNTRSRVSQGKALTYFSTKRSDINVYFDASLTARDNNQTPKIFLQSSQLQAQVRGDRLFLNSYLIEGPGVADVSPASSSLKVSDAENIFLIDTNQKKVEDVSAQIHNENANPEKILLALTNYSKNGNILSLSYPLTFQIKKQGEVIFEQSNIEVSDLVNFKPLSAVQTSGRLDFIITDASGYIANKTIDFIPEIAETLNVELGTTISQTGGNLTTHMVTLLDRFGNIAAGDIYNIDMNIAGGGLEFFDTKSDTFETKTIEGYKIFRLISTEREANNALSFTLKNTQGEVLATTSKTLRTLEKVTMEITSKSPTLKVGGEVYDFDIVLKDDTGAILTDFTSRAYLVINPTYGNTPNSYVQIENGTSMIQLQTKTIAGKDIKLEFQVEGLSDIVTQYIEILPDVPIKLDLSLSRDKIEASPDDSTLLYAVLKDRYGNEVFNDNSTIFDIEIAEGYEDIITTASPGQRAKNGKAQFEISGTDIPGIGYFKVGTTPSLDNNSFTLKGQAPFLKTKLDIPSMKTDAGLTETGKLFYKEFNSQTYITRFTTQYLLENSEAYKNLPGVLKTRVLDLWIETNQLVVNGVGENAGSIETFYFWNEENITGNKYNGIYSVLLGAPYGDISQENYLAGSLIFDSENRSLAVTSLLNNPYKFSDILSLGKGGNIKNISTGGDITQDIILRADFDSSNRMYVDIFNDALGTYVGKAYYKLGDTDLKECSDTLESCISPTTTSTSLKIIDSSYSLLERGNDLVIKNSLGADAIIFKKDGTIQRKSNLYIDIDNSNMGPYLKLLVRSGEDIVAEVALNLVDADINITRDETLLNVKLGTLQNTLIVYLKTNQYGTRDIFEKNGDTQKIIFYNDPFGSATTLDTFYTSGEQGIENFSQQKGIGWEDSNKSLLAFSAGENVGQSTQKYMSFSLINLGDPLVSLKPIQRDFSGTTSLKKSFDPTIGKLISGDESIVEYQVFDYNNDQKDDILLIKSDGYIELLENKDVFSDTLRKGNLVYAVDGGPARLVKTGDFTGDGYSDIFFVSEDGEPALFNNDIKNFTRTSLVDQLTLSGTIIQAEVFDMDADGKDDITTLDDAGQIHIFYGGGQANNPQFTKLKVGDGYGIKLSDTLLSRGGAIYFEELPQIDDSGYSADYITSSEELTAEIQDVINAGGDIPEPEFFNEYLADRLLFVQLPYTPYNFQTPNLTQEQILLQAVDAGIDTSNYEEFDAYLRESQDSLTNFIQENNSYINFNTSYGQSTNTYFLRSEYADTQDLVIEKRFTDLSPEFLQTGDLVEVELRIRNTGTQTLNNIAFVDTIARNFTLHSEEIEVVSEENKTIKPKKGVGMFDMLIDGFFLIPGEEVVLRYTLKTLPLKYGYMQVGLFEEGELGDDIWGDIILKPDHLNCGDEADIFTSVTQRSYTKGKTTPTCDENKLELPDSIGKNAIDTDNNGVPDYIDALVGGPEGDILDYAQEVLDDMNKDTDGDSVPDSDDALPNTNEDSEDFMSAIAGINQMVDDVSEDIDNIIEGFSCGFGGGSCIATPLNWAPLAPGGDPTLFGYPIGDGLKVNEGIPVFSALTGFQTMCGLSPCCIPTVYPASPLGFVPGPACGPSSAGGYLGTWAPTNYVRLFVTPTLTGGVGMAACFGGPAIVKGNIPPPGVSPIAPGGNCVVAAVPLLGCQGDEGDPTVTGYPWQFPQYGVINANCPSGVKDQKVVPEEIDNQFVDEYLEYKKTGVKTPSLVDKFKEAFQTVAKGGGNWNIPSGPLVNIGGGSDTDMSLSVDFDPSALGSGNFEDVIKVQNTRIAPFPDFLMDWVTRQLEEVVTKLTNLPKIFVILPDFSGIFDYGWEDFGDNVQDSFNSGKEARQNEKAQYQAQINSLQSRKDSLDCEGDDSTTCRTMDLQISQLNQKKNFSSPETLSGIREAYEFLGNVPLVNVEPETINVNVPWIDRASLDRVALDWRFTIDQWTAELQRASSAWSMGKTCNFDNAAEQAQCEKDNEISQNLYEDATQLIGSLEKNLEIIEEYKRFPEKLNKLISIKEVRLEQILCNIEAISGLLGEWISTNGERFKAWVELYVLIKAILKSWQLLIDVFKGYDEECHQCKNERQDLQTFIWKLISAVIPKVPIIQFPKWPDIILDLHNVRAGITLYLPDFAINLRPIVLPTLPQLTLPDVPTVGLTLPSLPILPEFTIPDLPDLPSLPTVELPDLPPPPKIPKLFGAVEGILNIMKLVTKVMCILKQSPFVPEWRAGDQIAYITERGGYLPTDFIDISLPQFSYPFVDAIKVTTYVNFEFETEFIIEAVRQITAPLDTFTNDIVNMFKIQVPDFDFSGVTPDDININLEPNGDTSINGEDLGSMNGTQGGIELLALMFASKIRDGIAHIESQKDITYTNKEFIAYVNENLASSAVSSNPRMDKILKVWEEVNSLSYSKEDKIIQALLKNKNEKFTELGDIITTEIQETQKLKQKINNLGEPDFITQTSFENTSNADAYNQRLSSYNDALVESAINLVEGKSQSEYETEIQSRGESLKSEIRGGLTAYSDNLNNPKLLAAEGDTPTSGGASSCSYSGDSYKYVYEGLYVLEYDRHYRLFEYLDELRGDEYVTPIDIDQDGDDDLLYMMSNQLFLKENLKNKDTKEHVSLPPLILNSGDNLFYNGDVYYEAVNGFEESNISDSFINVQFKAPTDTAVDNFRLEFFTIVDKFRNLGNDQYTPTRIKKFIVDAFADIEKNTLVQETPEYTIGKDLAHISGAGVIPGAKLTNVKLINIKEDLTNNNLVTLTSGAKLHAGRNSFTIEYYVGDPSFVEELQIDAHSYVQFPSLTSIVGLSGDAYIQSSILEDVEGAAIVGYIGKPLLPGAKITYSGNDLTLTEASHIDITYYDDSQIQMHMRDVDNYRLYDLGEDKEDHLIRLNLVNDFYYAKIYPFKDNINGTYSQQILLSPQTQADTAPPQLGLNQKIRIPVYQKQTIDLTPYIYEDSGIDNIVDVRIDFDFTTDNDQDGDPRNDEDTEAINIIQTPLSIKIEFGEHETLFERQIRIFLEDGNGNIGYKDIQFEVYPPAPQIQAYQDATISGVIDETLQDEPVRIYRVRGGAIKKLENSDGTDLIDTTADGSFDFGVPDTSKGLRLQKDGVDIAFINEYTGKITLQNPLATITTLASNNPRNEEGFPRISINYLGEEVFYQYIQPKFDPEISIIQSNEEITGEGIYVKILDQELYNSFTIPLGVAFNPGAVILHLSSDEDKKDVFSIFRDGRIYSGNIGRYTIAYREIAGRMSYVLRDTLSQTDIAQVILDIEASYILK